jgi:hypothetical protein
VAKRGPPTSGLSMLNWRFSPASHRPADTQVSVTAIGPEYPVYAYSVDPHSGAGIFPDGTPAG